MGGFWTSDTFGTQDISEFLHGLVNELIGVTLWRWLAGRKEAMRSRS